MMTRTRQRWSRYGVPDLLRNTFKYLIGSTALCASATLAGAQPVVTLGAPLYRTSAEFTDVSAARLFADGSMLVADPGAREFVRVSARGRVRTVLGRHGSGPGEYESAQQLLALPSGRLLLIDPPQNRWLVIDSLGAFQQIKVFGPSERMLRYAEFVDSRGNLYSLGFPAAPPAKALQPLLRWTAATERVDTVAQLAGAEMVAFSMKADAKGRPAGVAYFFVPFAAQDAWAVLPDGGFAVARADDERIEWHDATGRVVGTTRLSALPRVPVSDSARAAETRAAVRDRMPRTQPLWANRRMRVTGTGTVWMQRTRRPEETFTEYVELTAAQGVTRRLRIPGNARIVGERGDQVVVARRTEDDLLQLEVYVLTTAK